MKTIEEKIHAVADKMTLHPAYVYENWSQANVTLDSIERYPVVLNVLPDEGAIVQSPYSYNNRPKCAVAFLMPEELDFDLLDKDDFECDKVSQYDAANICYKMAIEFIDLYNKSGFFKPLEDVSYSIAHDSLDVNVIALILDFEAEELRGVSFCDTDKLF